MGGLEECSARAPNTAREGACAPQNCAAALCVAAFLFAFAAAYPPLGTKQHGDIRLRLLRRDRPAFACYGVASSAVATKHKPRQKNLKNLPTGGVHFRVRIRSERNTYKK